MTEALTDESDDECRATMVWVLGLVGGAEAVEPFVEDESELARVLASLVGEAEPSEHERARHVASIRMAPLGDAFPVDGGRVDMLLARVLESRLGRAEAANVLVHALAEPHPLAEAWVAGVLELGFALPVEHDFGAPFLVRSRARAVEDFDETQRAWLAQLSEHPWNAPFGSYAIPHRLRDRRRWLGLDPGGVMEQRVEVEVDGETHEVEVWRWLAHLQKGPDAKRRFEVLADRLEPIAVLEAMAETSMNAYGLRVLSKERVAERANALGAEAVAWARRFAEDLAVAVDRDRGASFKAFSTGAAIKPGRPTAGIVLELIAAEDGALEPHLDALVPPSNETLVALLSPKRCEAIILRALERYDRAPDLREANLAWEVGPMRPALDRSPTPAVAARLQELRERLGATGRHEDVEALESALKLVAG